MEVLYETLEVAKILQLSQRKIINWVERGFIIPAKEGRGTGKRRKYSFENLVRMKLIDKLTTFKISLPEIKMILDFFFKNRSKELNYSTLWEVFCMLKEKYLEGDKEAATRFINRYLIIMYPEEEKTGEKSSLVFNVSKMMLRDMIDKELFATDTKKDISKKFVERSAFLLIDLMQITLVVENQIRKNL